MGECIRCSMEKNNKTISFEDTSKAFSYKTDRQLKKSYLLFASINNRLLTKLGTNIVKLALKIKVPIKGIIRNNLFQQFCGGESIEECMKTVDLLSQYKVGAILDYAVEGEDTQEDHDKTVLEIKRTIAQAKTHRNIPFSVFKPTGIASIELLKKIHANESLSKKEIAEYDRVKKRFYELGKTAFEHKVRLFIDSEDSWIQNPIDELAHQMMEEFNTAKAYIFNTYQMYRKGMLQNMKDIVEHARGKFIVGAKLVRGAYMEKERERAEAMGYEDPILPTKKDTDKQYDDALTFCVENIEHIHFCCGSHNENSNRHLVELLKKHTINPNDERVFFAQLFGMSDNISFNLSDAGYNAVKYLPYGPVETVMPYLMRRAEENTSIAGQSSRELMLIKKELRRRKGQRAESLERRVLP